MFQPGIICWRWYYFTPIFKRQDFKVLHKQMRKGSIRIIQHRTVRKLKKGWLYRESGELLKWNDGGFREAVIWPFTESSLIFMLFNQHPEKPNLGSQMDYLSKGKVPPNTVLDRFVKNVWEKWVFCVNREYFRSLSSSCEKQEQKTKVWRSYFATSTSTSSIILFMQFTGWLLGNYYILMFYHSTNIWTTKENAFSATLHGSIRNTLKDWVFF